MSSASDSGPRPPASRFAGVARAGWYLALVLASAAGGAAALFGRDRGDVVPAGPTHLEVSYSEPAPPPADPSVLRVCADPNNLPFSNDREQGFENAIARILGDELDRRVEYYWQPQRRGFIRTTLNAGWCDVVTGVPADYELVATTRPYYRSTYVFVSRRGAPAQPSSLDDQRLKTMRIGVEMTGEDGDNPPAVQALASRHLVDNMRGYLVYGDYSTPDPPRRVIDAVANGEVETSIAWGPLAGYFARQSSAEPLVITPVTPEQDRRGVRFTFDIAMGVRHRDHALKDALDGALARRAPEIRRVLREYGVPLLPAGGAS
jgi:mxaJ protein